MTLILCALFLLNDDKLLAFLLANYLRSGFSEAPFLYNNMVCNSSPDYLGVGYGSGKVFGLLPGAEVIS